MLFMILAWTSSWTSFSCQRFGMPWWLGDIIIMHPWPTWIQPDLMFLYHCVLKFLLNGKKQRRVSIIPGIGLNSLGKSMMFLRMHWYDTELHLLSIIAILNNIEWLHVTEKFLGMISANERMCYYVTPSLIGGALTQNDSCVILTNYLQNQFRNLSHTFLWDNL